MAQTITVSPTAQVSTEPTHEAHTPIIYAAGELPVDDDLTDDEAEEFESRLYRDSHDARAYWSGGAR
jgi:hypothetical protein